LHCQLHGVVDLKQIDMKANTPNQIISELFKKYSLYYSDAYSNNISVHRLIDDLKVEMRKQVQLTGFVSSLSKANIIKLVRMQSALRFMPEHSFYLLFISALDEINN